MSPSRALPQGDLARVGWMVVAMAAFAVEDALLKLVLAQMPVAQVLFMFGVTGAIGFASLARLRGSPILTSAVFSWPMLIRSLSETAGRLFHVLAIALVPLSMVTAVLQAGPMLVVAGSALLYNERVGPVKWGAILLSLCGVALLLRPDAAGYSAWTILAVLGLLGTVGRDLAAQALPSGLSGAAIGVFGFLATAVAGLLAGLWEQRPPVLPRDVDMFVLMAAVAVGMLAYTGLTKATRAGATAVVAPFRYTRLIFGLVIGVVIFDETLSIPALTGCCLILMSGLIVLRKSGSGRCTVF